MWIKAKDGETNFRGYVFKFQNREDILEFNKFILDDGEELVVTKDNRDALNDYINSLDQDKATKKMLLTSVLGDLEADKEEIKKYIEDIVIDYQGYSGRSGRLFLQELIKDKVTSGEFTVKDYREIRQAVEARVKEEYLSKSLKGHLHYAFYDEERKLETLEVEIGAISKLLNSQPGSKEIMRLKLELEELQKNESTTEEQTKVISDTIKDLENPVEANNKKIGDLKEKITEKTLQDQNDHIHGEIRLLEDENSTLEKLSELPAESLKKELESKEEEKEKLAEFISNCKNDREEIIKHSEEHKGMHITDLINWYNDEHISDEDVKKILSAKLKNNYEKQTIQNATKELDILMSKCGIYDKDPNRKETSASKPKPTDTFLNTVKKNISDLESTYKKAKNLRNIAIFLGNLVWLVQNFFTTVMKLSPKKSSREHLEGSNPYDKSTKILDTTYGMHGNQDEMEKANPNIKTVRIINTNDKVFKNTLDQLLLNSDFNKEDLDSLFKENKDIEDYFHDRYQVPSEIKSEVKEALDKFYKRPEPSTKQ